MKKLPCSYACHLAISLIVILGEGSLVIAAPKPEPGGVRSGFYRPRAGFLRQVERQRIQAFAGPAFVGRTITPVQGTRRLPVVCLEFSNVSHPFSRQRIHDLLFHPEPGRKTMTQYFSDISCGRLQVTGDVLGWYRLPQQDRYYEGQDNGTGKPFGELLTFGLTAADQEIDFGQFDNDGPDGVPNSGDDDGFVDTVMFVHPEHGGENTTNPPAARNNNIWSHSWHYSDESYGHSAPFSTNDLRKARDGEPARDEHGKIQHILVEDYVIQPALAEAPGESGSKKLIEIGVFCHEYGHALGLPDLYDKTPRANGLGTGPKPDSLGLGTWCLMSYGSYGGDFAHSETPSALSAWCKQVLGWAQIVRISQTGTYKLEPVAKRNRIHRIDVPNSGGKEYFLIEFRDSGWKSENQEIVNWDEFLPQRGLAIWRVDERVGEGPDWPFAADDAGQNDTPSIPYGHPAFWWRKHALISLLQPDRRLDLENSRDAGGKGDVLIEGGRWTDDESLRFGSRDYRAQKTNITIDQVDLLNLRMRVTFTTPPAPPLPVPELDPVAPPVPSSTVAPSPASNPAVAVNPPLPPSPLAAGLQPKAAPLSALADLNLQLRKADLSRLVPRDSLKSRRANAMTDVLPGEDSPPKIMADTDQQLKAITKEQVDLLPAATFRQLNESQIQQSFDPAIRPYIRTLSANLRRKKFTVETLVAANPLEEAVAKFLREANVKNAVKLRVSPSEKFVDRLSGFSLPARANNPKEDAVHRMQSSLKELMAGNAVLQEPEVKVKGDTAAVRYQQMVKVEDRPLPVWGAGITLYYTSKEGSRLRSLASEIVPSEEIAVTGRSGQITPAEAKAMASELLHVDPKRLMNATEGVKLFEADPQRARVAYRISYSFGEGRQPLEIYLDTENRRILAIE